ncbi:alpha-ketoglutaric semialdehyde dehydrogenase [Sphingobium sp. SYK-6]|uniref:aldehyde dehydrogenase (NADP(+)) n=1 Tax=Sphingobium sp. (strain NBRC 103272 / SYK-6) TaxID=627192 RepID=UPI00022772BB|nr:aldehyde dehydrogenase (NADP(+)) [Sphingobium sp. SYK-6]BAK66496.1 alpha-ketoglutaric semialdehyde dehydrogenase [Sphingobium sp. SYK-6]
MTGAILVGGEARSSDRFFQATDPATGELIEARFPEAGVEDVDAACRLADLAFMDYAMSPPARIAAFLEKIAENILAIGDELIVSAMRETGLPRPRLEGERGRTVGQLRLFAGLVRQGEWIDARIDPAMPDRAPAPRSDIRSRKMALGPVAVFGASNFPLAFSVAGGDTASALAAGCPVVFKGHPAHPATGELVARAIQSAVSDCGLPEGVFSYLPGPSHELGQALVAHPLIAAVGFTGSRAGGLALMKTAAAREVPVPVYAEMSSINPVLLLPSRLKAAAEALGGAFVGSLTMGAGQFCTNPGLLLVLDGPDADRFLDGATKALVESAALTMLTPGIHAAYCAGIEALADHGGARLVARGLVGEGPHMARAALFETSASQFLSDPVLSREVFGSTSLLVRCKDEAELCAVLEGLEGQLTATLHMDEGDQALAGRLMPRLIRKVGRILANGWPTGVEVTHAMVHGGPFPATSDGRTTSVGTMAIERFLRPVCFQDISDALLPEALRQSNPLSLPLRVDGQRI